MLSEEQRGAELIFSTFILARLLFSLVLWHERPTEPPVVPSLLKFQIWFLDRLSRTFAPSRHPDRLQPKLGLLSSIYLQECLKSRAPQLFSWGQIFKQGLQVSSKSVTVTISQRFPRFCVIPRHFKVKTMTVVTRPNCKQVLEACWPSDVAINVHPIILLTRHTFTNEMTDHTASENVPSGVVYLHPIIRFDVIQLLSNSTK